MAKVNSKGLTTVFDGLGSSVSGRTITATLFVSPNGDNTDGSTWAKAYQTIQAALDVASTDANDCTLILVAPHSTYYDINTTGNPTWSCNVEIKGTHRKWAPVKNTHASATSIFKFTGKASIQDLAISHANINGVIFTQSGARVRHCGFNSEGSIEAANAIYLDGSAALTNGAILEDIHIRGNSTYTTGIHINQSKVNNFNNISIHDCLVGVHIEDADSDNNFFYEIDVGDSALAFDIDGGNEHHFHKINLHHNTRNFDDEVGDHTFRDIEAASPITAYPDDFTGVTVPSAVGANTWGALTEMIAAAAIDNPFRVVGVVLQPAVSQLSRIRFTGDAGTIYFDDLLFDANRKAGSNAPGGTDFVFNAGTKIEAAAKVVGGGPDNIVTWLKIQVI